MEYKTTFCKLLTLPYDSGGQNKVRKPHLSHQMASEQHFVLFASILHVYYFKKALYLIVFPQPASSSLVRYLYYYLCQGGYVMPGICLFACLFVC